MPDHTDTPTPDTRHTTSSNGTPLSRDVLLFRTLVLEEWRLHVRLFGGRRFLAFPLVIAGLVGAGAVALNGTGYTDDSIVTGLHVIALAFGLYSGSAAFAGSDMLENVFGDLSLVLGSANTLPLSPRRLLGHFLCKDALFYGLTIVFPLSLAVVPLEGVSASTMVTVAATWLSLFLLFSAGMAVTVAVIALRTRGLSMRLFGVGVLVAGTLWWRFETPRLGDVLAFPLLANSPWVPALVVVGTATIAGISLRIYDPTASAPTRTYSRRFRTVESLPGSNPLVAKSLLDLARSSGGLWKPIVSAGIILGLVAFLVTIVREITTIEPSLGVFFGSVLGLSAFTTYNWLTQFDAVESYGIYPLSIEAVFEAKRVAFYLIGVPTMSLAYLAALVWFRPPVLEAAVGFVLLVGLALYYYGLTVYIAGFDPNEFLFDAVRFVGFTAGVAVVMLPTLVVGFVVVPLTPVVSGALVATGVAAGVFGHWLSRRAGARWTRRYRRGV